MPRGDSKHTGYKYRTYSHPDLMDEPVVLLYFEHFDRIIYFLLSTAEKATKSVYKLIIYSAS